MKSRVILLGYHFHEVGVDDNEPSSVMVRRENTVETANWDDIPGTDKYGKRCRWPTAGPIGHNWATFESTIDDKFRTYHVCLISAAKDPDRRRNLTDQLDQEIRTLLDQVYEKEAAQRIDPVEGVLVLLHSDPWKRRPETLKPGEVCCLFGAGAGPIYDEFDGVVSHGMGSLLDAELNGSGNNWSQVWDDYFRKSSYLACLDVLESLHMVLQAYFGESPSGWAAKGDFRIAPVVNQDTNVPEVDRDVPNRNALRDYVESGEFHALHTPVETMPGKLAIVDRMEKLLAPGEFAFELDGHGSVDWDGFDQALKKLIEILPLHDPADNGKEFRDCSAIYMAGVARFRDLVNQHQRRAGR